MNKTHTKKIIPLESMRGIAAFIVFLYHFILGFTPQWHGLDAKVAIVGANLKETPFFFFINGLGAVTFFFVLSGFVLSYKFFSTRDTSTLIHSVIKRWPRLFPLALISTLISCFLIKNDLYYWKRAAKITHSSWMSSFAHAQSGFQHASYFDAFLQGFFYTFFRGDENLNSSLWTMNFEFIGSLIVFGLIGILNKRKAFQGLLLIFTVIVTCYHFNVLMIPFVMGCFLSFCNCQIGKFKNVKNSPYILIPALIFAFLALGYLEPGTGFYGFMNIFGKNSAFQIRIILHSLASIVLIQSVLNYDFLYKLFDNKVGRFLGRSSFALYVFHVPLMFSFSAFLFLYLRKPYGYITSVVVTFFATTIILILLSWLLTLIDEFWSKIVNTIVKNKF